MSREGGMVACVLNREGRPVLGGCFCLGRMVLSRVFPGRVCLPDIITLRGRNRFPGLSKSALPQQNYLPGIESPSRYRIALRIDRESLFFVGFARIGRVVLSVEGVVVARFSWSCLSG